MIEVHKEHGFIVALGIPSTMTQEEAQTLLQALAKAVDEDYSYHCGAVANPLPYQQFKAKKRRLDYLLNKPIPDKLPSHDPAMKWISKLSRELGY